MRRSTWHDKIHVYMVWVGYIADLIPYFHMPYHSSIHDQSTIVTIMSDTTKPNMPKVEEKSENKLSLTYSHNVGQVVILDPHHDAVFGDIGEGGPNYRDVWT